MDHQTIGNYHKILSKLNRAVYNGKRAPHKPVLLISIIQLIQEGEIHNNQITISPELVLRFKENFKWLVKEEYFSANFSLPFYHLRSENFWHLALYPGKQLALTSSNSIKSFSQLQANVAYANFDEPLFELLKEDHSSKIIYDFLLSTYFPDADLLPTPASLENKITEEILHAKPGEYKTLIDHATEEEVFVRSAVFRKVIPQSYDYSCCITDFRIHSPFNIQMVDACHIIPFADSHDDTIGNGLCMSPNLHRAFDRGLVAIDDNYEILVSSKFEDRSPFEVIRNLEGTRIKLPANQEYYPSLKNLAWHREVKFRN